ncbi:MAG: MBL fold metallo-hydrolase [Alphaproteobacteria bacterium]|nr:MBL fold metallo-hydrolase [Alphaproteobacteria bacterium]
MNIKLIASGTRPWQRCVRYWGLSFVIDDTVLFDTFANYGVLSKKLRQAKIDASKIQTVVISHDHWDHIGGLWQFLEKRTGIDVYLPASAAEATKNRMRAAGCRVIVDAGAKEVKAGVFVTDEIMGEFNGKPLPEQALALKSGKGLVLIVGCSHPGIWEIVKRAKELFNAPVYGVVGGLHLMHADATEICQCANGLKNEGITMVAPTHCAGRRAERIFQDVFRNGFVSLREGQYLSL